jgi:hypothetical protein
MSQQKQKPPVPPANRSPKGTGADPEERNPVAEPPENTEQTGERANVRQNTTAGGGRQTK